MLSEKPSFLYLLMMVQPRSSALSQAVKLLARRDHSERELRGKLLQRGYTAVEIDSALIKLREKGYVDDRALSKKLAENLWGSGKYGIAGVRCQLRKNGFNENEVIEASDGFERCLELSYAVALLERRKLSSDNRDKAGRFLASRGFAYQTIEQALDQIGLKAGNSPLD